MLVSKTCRYRRSKLTWVVTYALRRAKLLNMVLLVPDDMPEDGPSTLQGQVDEMQNLFKDWDPK